MTVKQANQQIGFGGGCHWCTEAVFQSLRGVDHVEQGFINAPPPHNEFSEAVIVHYDPAVIPLSALTEIHLRTHASGSNHSMRGKYRSAVYVNDPQQRLAVSDILQDLKEALETPPITQVLDMVAFKPSDTRFQNYYKNGPKRPFCKTYIDPKLARLKSDFAVYYQSKCE